MNFQISQIQTPENAKLASEFLKTLDAFEDSGDWNNEERNKLSNDPYNSLQLETHFSWLAISNNKVIG